jgi:hypothetical protein
MRPAAGNGRCAEMACSQVTKVRLRYETGTEAISERRTALLPR